MQQRQLRLGDILDDYCPRERRLTNHAVVAMIGEDVKQTRCTTCDAEHEYKHAKVPRQRRKADTPPALYAQVAAGAPKRVPHDEPDGGDGHDFDEPMIEPDDAAGASAAARERSATRPMPRLPRRTPARTPRTTRPAEADREEENEEGPVHRPLIRASLPRPEGQPPPTRPAPDFTIRQPGGRPNRFRPRHPRAGQPFRGQSLERQLRRTAARPPAPECGRRRAADAGSGLRAASDPSNVPDADLAGKHGLIVGVANKRSISWAIAQAAAAAGARLALTYPERAARGERPRAGRQAGEPARAAVRRVERSADCRARRRSLDREFGGLDFLVHGAAFAPGDALSNPFVETTRESFRIALDVSTYSLVALTRAVVPLMERRGGGSVLTLTYLGSQRVFTNYNVMGVAKAALEASVRYLASDLGPKNIRVNAISAGPIKTLAASGISGFSNILQVYRDRAPLRRNVELAEVADAAVFLLSPASRAITGEVVMVDAGYHAVGI